MNRQNLPVARTSRILLPIDKGPWYMGPPRAPARPTAQTAHAPLPAGRTVADPTGRSADCWTAPRSADLHCPRRRSGRDAGNLLPRPRARRHPDRPLELPESTAAPLWSNPG